MKFPNLDQYDDKALGPIGLHDAMFLHALTAYIKPSIAVEYGCLNGKSSLIISPTVGKLLCVDIEISTEMRAVAKKHPNIVLVESPMEEWIPPIGPIDFVFFDAAHECPRAIKAMENITPFLSNECLLAVHDTGDWPDVLTGAHKDFQQGRMVQTIEERKFCNTLRSCGWDLVSLGTKKDIRHGITLLKKSQW